MDIAVQTERLTRRFGRLSAVEDVSMTVPTGAVYGFLGRNGAGKTTTLKMLLGLLRPTTGVLRVAGIDVAADRRGAARHVGALLEAHGFYGNLSGRENLDLTRRLLGLAPREIDRVLGIVDLASSAGRRVSGYSLGMRQRLGIARALLGAPSVLILDEPTNGLDPEGIAEMRTFLRELPRREGTTVLLSSHLLSEIELTASHVGVLRNGRLVLEGSLARLKADLPAELCVDIDDPDRGIGLAVAGGYCASRTPDGFVVTLDRTEDVRGAAAALTRTLVDHGLKVFAVAPRPRSLETLYRDVDASVPEPTPSDARETRR